MISPAAPRRWSAHQSPIALADGSEDEDHFGGEGDNGDHEDGETPFFSVILLFFPASYAVTNSAEVSRSFSNSCDTSLS